MTTEEAKILVCDSGKRLLADGLVTGTWGNISVRVNKDVMVITPSGRKYEELAPGEMVAVNIHTLEYEGSIKPSSELKLHVEIYKQRSNIQAVIHTHQPHASAVAAAHREVPPILDDMCQIIGPSIRNADYALPNTKKLVKNTMKALEGRFAALMANHGAVCIGRDMEEAFLVAQVLEKTCYAFIEAEFLGGAKGISKMEAYIMHQYFILKYSKEKKRNKV